MDFRNFKNISEAADFIAQPIISALKKGKRVLWLVPGGSAISVAVLAAQKIALYPHHRLAVTLTDERYGAVGHADSNWRQLLAAGFSLPQAESFPVLSGASQSDTVRSFSKFLAQELERSDHIAGLFGLGADGHTAGILPSSPAVSSPDPACFYEAGPFQRITITPRVIGRLSEAVVYAVGREKWPALMQLKENLEINKQPAQALKQAGKSTIFSDYQYENNN